MKTALEHLISLVLDIVRGGRIPQPKTIALDVIRIGERAKQEGITKEDFELIEALIRHINKILRISSKKKVERLKLDYVADWIYKIEVEKKDYDTYFSINLHFAIESLKKLKNTAINEFKKGNLKPKQIQNIIDIIFDIKPFVEHFAKKKDSNYQLFSGYKNYRTRSDDAILACKNMLVRSSINEDIKDSVNIANFLLRQAFELRYKGLTGFLTAKYSDGSPVKINHEFLPTFVENNQDIIIMDHSGHKTIKKAYKFTNIAIHYGINPTYWQIEFGISLFYQFLGPKDNVKTRNGIFNSVYGSVIIKDYNELKSRLVAEINNKNQKANQTIVIEFAENPDALVEK